MSGASATWGMMALAAALASPGSAAAGEPAALLQHAREPGPGVERAAIEFAYTYHARPEHREIEKEARWLERQAIADGKSAAMAKSIAAVHRRFGRAVGRGLVRRTQGVARYDAGSWSVDEWGAGAVNGEPYREAWYANGRESYERVRTPAGTRVNITATQRAQPLALGPAIFFRRPQLARSLNSWRLQPAGRDAQGRTILRGDIRSGQDPSTVQATVALWIDPRYGHWPTRMELRAGGDLFERCEAGGFRLRPGGVWFPTRVEDTMFALRGAEKGTVRLRRTYVVRSARFNEKAGAAPGPPQMDRATRVFDYRFGTPIVYASTGSYRPASEVQREARRLAFRHHHHSPDQQRVLTLRVAAALMMLALSLWMAAGWRERVPRGERGNRDG